MRSYHKLGGLKQMYYFKILEVRSPKSKRYQLLSKISRKNQSLPILASSRCCSDAKSCPTLCNPVDCRMPDLPVPHHLPEFAQVHVNWISNAIQPSHPLSPSSSDFNISQHQSQLFASGGQSIEASSIRSSSRQITVSEQESSYLIWGFAPKS